MRRSFSDFTNTFEGLNECLDLNFLFQPLNEFLNSNEKKSPVTSENVNVDFDSSQNTPKDAFGIYGRYNEIEEFIQMGPDYRNENQQKEKPQIGKKSTKKQKSGLYSKNYRQKKKEYIKMIEEENIFLKRKLDQLQHRLRDKEIELNRIKFSSNKDQFNIHKINEEITKKLALIADQNQGKFDNNNSQKKQSFSEQQKKIAQFLNFYQNDGPGGKKTLELLDYYMNEFLENMMRDREKYYFMKCVKTEAELKNISGLDITLMETFETNEQNRKKFVYFCKLMRPVCLQVKEACREFYKSYKKVMNAMERKHETMKYYLSENKSIDFLKRRLKIILWFQANHYRKEMQNLRDEWIQMIKDGDMQDETFGGDTFKKRNY